MLFGELYKAQNETKQNLSKYDFIVILSHVLFPSMASVCMHEQYQRHKPVYTKPNFLFEPLIFHSIIH